MTSPLWLRCRGCGNAGFTVMLKHQVSRCKAKQPVPNFEEVLLITPVTWTDYRIYFVGLAVSSLRFCLVQGQANLLLPY